MPASDTVIPTNSRHLIPLPRQAASGKLITQKPTQPHAGLRSAALLNAALSPFLLLFLLIYFFMRNAERFYHHPGACGFLSVHCRFLIGFCPYCLATAVAVPFPGALSRCAWGILGACGWLWTLHLLLWPFLVVRISLWPCLAIRSHSTVSVSCAPFASRRLRGQPALEWACTLAVA